MRAAPAWEHENKGGISPISFPLVCCDGRFMRCASFHPFPADIYIIHMHAALFKPSHGAAEKILYKSGFLLANMA